MPGMDIRVDARTPGAVLFSWLVAALAIPLTLLTAAVGQGAGAYLGGCTWIGLALPLDRQVWALVNQPVMNFASTAAAAPYWLGSLLLPLGLAATLVPFVPRARSLAGELTMVQLSWIFATVGCAWLPLLDPVDGHLVRLLGFRMLPEQLLWLAPAVATAAILLPTFRLLALARMARTELGRMGRAWVVVSHLAPPLVGWIVLVSVLRGGPPMGATIAALVPLLVAVTVAWIGYPSPYVRPLEELSAMSYVRTAVVAVVLVALIWFAGRPLPDDQRGGLLWGHRDGFNNVRPWMKPTELVG